MGEGTGSGRSTGSTLGCGAAATGSGCTGAIKGAAGVRAAGADGRKEKS